MVEKNAAPAASAFSGKPIPVCSTDSPLLAKLKERNTQKLLTSRIYETVDDWTGKFAKIFTGESFASQWGAIRSIASIHRDYDSLYKEILDYISRGVAKDKWAERRRKASLEDFIKETHNDELPCGHEWLTLLNLSSVMAKLSKNK